MNDKVKIEQRGSVMILCPYCYIKFEDAIVNTEKGTIFCPRCIQNIKFDDLVRAKEVKHG